MLKIEKLKVEQKLDVAIKERDALREDLAEALLKNSEMECRLRQYENPHMPSSRRQIGQKGKRRQNGTGKEAETKPGGSRKGRPGITSVPDPTCFETHKPDT